MVDGSYYSCGMSSPSVLHVLFQSWIIQVVSIVHSPLTMLHISFLLSTYQPGCTLEVFRIGHFSEHHVGC